MVLKKTLLFLLCLVSLWTSYPSDLFAQQTLKGPFAISSPEFGYGMRMPLATTRNYENRPPTLVFRDIPLGTRSLAIQMVDPESPSGPWIHWLVANIPPSSSLLTADNFPEEAVIGVNDFGNSQYDGPSPPSGTHRYLIHVYALDVIIPLKPGFNYRKLENGMWGHILQRATLMGTFSTNL